MTTTVNTRKTYCFEFSLGEIAVLNEVNRIIKNIQDSIGIRTSIISHNTGELIEAEELRRMRGVLDAIIDNNGGIWKEFN